MVNAILAGILSFLIPGLGQAVAGDIKKGVIFFIIALDSLVFSMWFLPIILFIIAEIVAINRLVYWDELKRILFID